MRASALGELNKDYVAAARVAGGGTQRRLVTGGRARGHPRHRKADAGRVRELILDRLS